tara:strand:+ start:5735 stop:6103 length:369 start_codon:yes stop_codon:yes gene_type:complete
MQKVLNNLLDFYDFMGIIGFFRDYRECHRTEKDIKSLMWDIEDHKYRTINEANDMLDKVYELLKKAKELNKTSSAGVLSYIPTKWMYDGMMRLEQKAEDDWILGRVPVGEDSVSDKVLQDRD